MATATIDNDDKKEASGGILLCYELANSDSIILFNKLPEQSFHITIQVATIES